MHNMNMLINKSIYIIIKIVLLTSIDYLHPETNQETPEYELHCTSALDYTSLMTSRC